MALRVSNVRLSVDQPEASLPGRVAFLLGLGPGDPLRWRILRKALDARDKADLQFVYTLEVTAPEDEVRLAELAARAAHAAARVDLYHEEPFAVPPPGAEPLRHRPLVVGSGPGGPVAAYFL